MFPRLGFAADVFHPLAMGKTFATLEIGNADGDGDAEHWELQYCILSQFLFHTHTNTKHDTLLLRTVFKENGLKNKLLK